MTADRSSIPSVPDPQGLGEDPYLYFTKVYLTYLQGLFRQRPSGSWRWSESQEDTEIMITDQAPIPHDQIEQRPAIVTMRGPSQFAGMTMDQLREIDRRTGTRTHTDMVTCTMTLNCISKNGLEAQRLGWFVQRHIGIANGKRLLQKYGIFKIYDNIGCSGETPPGSLVAPEPTPEMTMTVVTSPFAFQWTERVTPLDAPTFEAAELHMEANLHPLPLEQELTKNREVEIYHKRPTIRGIPIQGTATPLTPIKTTVKT